MEKVKGSMEVLSSIQLTEDMAGLDAHSKTILRNKEVLSIILQGVVTEYKGYSRKEIMDFIETESITDEKEVSTGRTNTRLRLDSTEFVQLNEKTSNFDLTFRARNPVLSTKDVLVSLHIDLEPQKTYRPGYPIEKRGIYYLARSLSSQLSLVTGETDYGKLEKCYSIWICKDDIPKEAQYSISVYEMTNTKSSGHYTGKKENYDLMTLVVIKLGNKVYNGKKEEEWYNLFRFLNIIMYPHGADTVKAVSEYIDFSGNEELWREVTHMSGLGLSIFEEGIAEGRQEGRQEGIRALILDNLEEKIPGERIIAKLQHRFNLTREAAEQYYEKFSR